MMKIISMCALLMTTTAFGGEVKNCKLEGKTMTNIVLPNDVAVKSIGKVLQSKISTEQQRKQIKAILYIEGISIGDGKSMCDLAEKNYNVTAEKCEDVLESNDLIDLILEDSSDIKDLTLGCKIGINAKLLMQFNM